MLKLSNVRHERWERKILGDITVIQSWIHTNLIMTNFAAGMRSGRSLSAGLCANFDNPKYQPETVGLDRLGRKI